MAVLEVVKAGHPVLKEVAEPVEHVNKKLRKKNATLGARLRFSNKQ